MLLGENIATAMKSVVADPSGYDWEGDAPLRHPSARTIIYEMHVRGFTHHPSSGVSEHKRGTFAGLVEKIPYLQQLGITAVESLPIFQFDPQDCPPGKVNYWGYSPVSFFAPHNAYSSCRDPPAVLDEFRDMVKRFTERGLRSSSMSSSTIRPRVITGDRRSASAGSIMALTTSSSGLGHVTRTTRARVAA
jgi:isoamylase